MPDDVSVTDLIRVEHDGAIARITLNRPEAGNSLTPDMRDHLADAFDELSATLGVRAVVLTGAGEKHFCTGAGLGSAQKAEPTRPAGAPDKALGDVARMVRRGWQRLVTAILDCEKPVVAAVNGTAAGGGANLVLACDLVVMADTARLIEVFVTRGIIPDAGGCYLLPRIVGPQRAKEIMFLGDAISAVDCERYGIANRVVPADRPRRRGRRAGRPVGHRPDEGDRHDQVAGEPQLGEQPARRLRGGGLRPGARHRHGRHGRGHRRLRRAPGS